MTSGMGRREFLAGAAAGAAAIALARPAPAEEAKTVMEDLGFPLVDFHVHLDNLGLEKALAISEKRGVRFGIVEHAGRKENEYPVVLSSDADLARHLEALEGKGVYRGVQAERLDWVPCFSKEIIARLDYVLTDALTFLEKDGRWVELWKTEKVRIGDKQDFMERYVAHHLRVIRETPIDILANGTFLPQALQGEFDTLWTPERMKRIIDAAVACGVAIEINSSMRLPRPAFLKMAREAGARFSFGSNFRGPDVGKLDYCVETARALGLKREDMFTPAPPGKKPVEVRTFGK